MTQYATLNPLGSTSPYDLFDNAQNFDFAINDITNAIWQDRFGRNRQTWYGLEQLAKAAIAAFGYITLDSFQAGATLNLPNQVLRDTSTGEYYRWDG
ncbi:phage tail protein, partial [Enterobacter asburiae]|nr:phage tail protein [Enterobacter asburiae]